jgi:hypothetical protein
MDSPLTAVWARIDRDNAIDDGRIAAARALPNAECEMGSAAAAKPGSRSEQARRVAKVVRHAGNYARLKAGWRSRRAGTLPRDARVERR